MPKRVLIVDDSPLNQKVVAYMVESLGLHYDVVSTGLEAVLAVGVQDYAFVLMDLRTPDMDGFAATKSIRESGNDVPIIGFSAYPMTDDVRRCMEAGMNDFLPKPLDKATFETACARWVGSAKPEKSVCAWGSSRLGERTMENGELASLGLSAYHSGDYTTATEFLSALTKQDPNLWQCRLYLAMAYFQVSHRTEACEELRTITDLCPDRLIKEKALAALRAINSQSHQKLETLSSQVDKKTK